MTPGPSGAATVARLADRDLVVADRHVRKDMPAGRVGLVLVPEEAAEDQLQLLANLAELLDNDHVRQSIDKCNDSNCLYQLLCQNPENLAA